MGFLFGKQPSQIPDYTGIQIQTSVNTMPIPIIYGTPRCSVNLIYYVDFQAVPTGQNPGGSGKGGGKGLLFGGKGGASSYNYFATIILALGEGPIDIVQVIFQDQGIYNPSATPGNGALVIFAGGRGQAPWEYIVETHPTEARGYTETAYLAGATYPLDSSATVPQFNVLAIGFYNGTCPLFRADYTIANANAPASPAEQVVSINLDMDADPSLVIFDFLTNPQYGVLGFTPSLPGLPSITFPYRQGTLTFQTFIDPASLFSSPSAADLSVGDSAFQTYCQAVGFGMSICLNTTEQASSVLDRWTKLLSTAVVWTGALLKFIPYWDTPTQANPGYDSGNEAGIPMKYFVPNITSLFSFTDEDYVRMEDGADPVTYERIDTADIYNTVRLDFKDRFNLWNDNVVEAKNENAIEVEGIREDSLGFANEFTLDQFAANAAQAAVNRNTAIRNKFTFKLSWEYGSILDPMDIVSITDQNLGLDAFPVRILSITEDDKFEVEIVAEEFRFGASSFLLYPKQQYGGGVYNTNMPSNAVNVPFIYEPTQAQLAAQGAASPTIVAALSASVPGTGMADGNFGGADVYVSDDNVTYMLLGRFNGHSTQGLLTATLPIYSSANPDNTNTLSVDLTESGGELSTVTADQAQSGLSLCAVNNGAGIELIAYTTATMTGPFTYNLTGLYRAQYDTVSIASPSGSQFVFLGNGAVFSAPLPPQFIGEDLFLKFTSFNSYNSTEQNIADVTAYMYSVTGVGTTHQAFNVTGAAAGVPGSSAVIQRYVFAQTVNFPVGLTGSQGVAGIAATALATFLIKKNGTNVGSMAWAISGTVASFTMGSATTFGSGDVLTIVAPASPDATLANLSWTLVGST